MDATPALEECPGSAVRGWDTTGPSLEKTTNRTGEQPGHYVLTSDLEDSWWRQRGKFHDDSRSGSPGDIVIYNFYELIT